MFTAGPRNATDGDWDPGIHFDLVHDDHQVDSLTAQLSLRFTFQMFLALDYEFKDIIVTLTCIWHQDTQKRLKCFYIVELGPDVRDGQNFEDR